MLRCATTWGHRGFGSGDVAPKGDARFPSDVSADGTRKRMEAVSVAVVGVVVVVVSEVASATLARRCWKGDFVGTKASTVTVVRRSTINRRSMVAEKGRNFG